MDKGQTLQAHLLDEVSEGRVTDDLLRVLTDLVRPATQIAAEVNKAGLVNIIGLTGQKNVHGEEVKKLDMFADRLLVQEMRESGSVCGMASEENEDYIPPSRQGEGSRHVLFFDPLDGSSNIDVNVSIGTIFSVYERKSESGPAVTEDYLRAGSEQVAAGYFLYGTSTMLVYTAGHGVHGFTLDPATREFRMSHPSIRTPSRGKIVSCNEAYAPKWDEPTRQYVTSLRDEKRPGGAYTTRYVGSFVADFHRNLLKGGIFLYPGEAQDASPLPKGKLRLMYEGNPMAMLVEQAGGAATDGERPILSIQATEVHHRTPLVIGSKEDVEEYLSLRK